MEERDKSQEDKTEDPSEERRRQFREEGQLVSSKELISSISIISFTILFIFFYTYARPMTNSLFRRIWINIPTLKSNSESAFSSLFYELIRYLPIGGFLILVLCLVPLMAGLLLSNFYFSWNRLEFKLDKLNFFSGIMRIFSTSVFFETLKAILKFSILGSVAVFLIKRQLENSHSLYGMSLESFFFSFTKNTVFVLTALSISMLVIGILDYGYNYFQMEKKLKMTKQEIKDEHKNQEGDPHIKGKRRRMARDFSFRQSVTRVEKATFVVTNPQHFAVAIRYVKGMAAPIVVAKGQDWMALKIRQLAKSKDIVIVENKPLARALYKSVKIGGEIPPNLYTAIIEVMKVIYRLKGSDYFGKFNN